MYNQHKIYHLSCTQLFVLHALLAASNCSFILNPELKQETKHGGGTYLFETHERTSPPLCAAPPNLCIQTSSFAFLHTRSPELNLHKENKNKKRYQREIEMSLSALMFSSGRLYFEVSGCCISSCQSKQSAGKFTLCTADSLGKSVCSPVADSLTYILILYTRCLL